jgi:hypothetical protein
LPTTDKIPMLDKAFDGAATNLVNHGYNENIVTGIFEQGADLKHVVQAETGYQNKLFWLEEGTPDGYGHYKDGWYHIVEKHITGAEPGGTLFPSSMTEEEVKQLIFSAVNNPASTIESKGNILYYHEMIPANGKYIRVASDPSGKIYSAYMVNNLP